MQREDQQNLLTQQQQEQCFHHINLTDLGLYRVRAHCQIDPQSVSTGDFSVFQLEIVDQELQRYYQGRFILEVWDKKGERIFQKVLKEECTQWKLCNNVLVFKSSTEAPLIYIMWLLEKKMIAIKHPFEDHKEVDLIYYDGFLVVTAEHSFKYVQISPSEVTTQISQFQHQDDSLSTVIEKEASGRISQDRIMALIPNPTKHELIFLCQNQTFQLQYFKFTINLQLPKQQVSLVQIEQDPAAAKNKSKLDSRAKKLQNIPSEAYQFHVTMRNNVPHLLVVRKNQILEIVENFQTTVAVEQIQKLAKVLPSFGESITLQFEDGSITQTQSYDKFNDRNFLTESEYYKQLTLPPKATTLYELHKMVHFYQDIAIINHSVFLLRDNIVFVYDSISKQVVSKFFSKNRVLSLHKLKHSTEDEQGYKVMSYKVVALHRNGYLQVFSPNDTNLMTDWQRHEIQNTTIFNQKESVLGGFQNQYTLNYLYITTINASNEQRIYQLLYNNVLVETNILFGKQDQIFSVNTTSRQRELLGVVDHKNFNLYKNDKGSLTKLYQLSLAMAEFKDALSATSSMFYFQREYIIVINNKRVYKISTRTNQVESTKLKDAIQSGGNCFVDAQFFYFLSKSEEEGGYSKLSVTSTDMVEAVFTGSSNENQAALAIADKEGSNKTFNYPTWAFQAHIKRLEYDEFNSTANLLLSNLEIIQVPMVHRNTIQFMGMAERLYYIAFKKHGDRFFALDKANHVSSWSTITGQLESRTRIADKDYTDYEVDRKVYDKEWFDYTVIYKPNSSPGEDDNIIQQVTYNTYKLIKIDDRGNVIEKLSFVHSSQKHMEQHMYFNKSFTQMIEILINKTKKTKATYNLYNATGQPHSVKWEFANTINQELSDIEWHHKTLYPYNLNLATLQPINKDVLLANQQQHEIYKQVGKNSIKVLNIQDGIEMVLNEQTGNLEAYLALQYSFQNTKDSFYDKRCGQFFVQEVILRLQNFYEQIRRKIFLHNNLNVKTQSIDTSAKNFKHKYLIETSFTYFDFKFYSQYIQNYEKQLYGTLKTMSTEHIKRLIHNVFPVTKNTLMHFIAEKQSGFECVDFLSEISKKEGFVVPFLINRDELTPIDITVKNKDHKQTNSLIKMLSKCPMDHHSRLISHLMPKLIGMNIPALDKYFDKRRFQTGVCNTITLGKIKIDDDQTFRAITTTISNENSSNVSNLLFHKNSREQSIQLELLDLPLQQRFNEVGLVGGASHHVHQSGSQKKIQTSNLNRYELDLIDALANTDDQQIFDQKTLKAYVDFMWPKARHLIITNLFLPYLAFILYYMMFLMVLKKLNATQLADPTFFQFTAGMFNFYDFLFKLILFIGCLYFFQHDFLQIKNTTNNKIVLWSYANIMPLILMIFIIVYATLVNSETPQLQKTFYSLSAFFIWIRVIHLLRCFDQTAYLLRMGAAILYRMRYLLVFILISLVAFGFTFYFLEESVNSSPYDGISQMFLVLVGNYSAEMFNNAYLAILFVMISFFNIFFIFTMIVSLSVQSFNNDNGLQSNVAYQDKASMISLYSYLLTEKAVREPAKKYLLIATLTESKAQKSLQKGSGAQSAAFGVAQEKNLMKNMDRRMNTLTGKVDKTLKEIQEKLDILGDTQMKHFSKERSNSKVSKMSTRS